MKYILIALFFMALVTIGANAENTVALIGKHGPVIIKCNNIIAAQVDKNYIYIEYYIGTKSLILGVKLQQTNWNKISSCMNKE